MLTDVAAIVRHASITFPGDGLFVLGVILLVVLILARVYGGRRR